MMNYSQGSMEETPELKITTLTTGVEGGLKFRSLDDDHVIVEHNEKTIVEHFTAARDHKKLLLRNYNKLEHFCNRKSIEETEKDVFRYYVVVKNFSNETINAPGTKAKLYVISQDQKFLFNFTVYANGEGEADKGFVCIRIERDADLRKGPEEVLQKTVFFISVIDNNGIEAYIKSGGFEIGEKGKPFFLVFEPFKEFISRETVLNNSQELLHFHDLVLCFHLEIDKNLFEEIEKTIEEKLRICCNASEIQLSLNDRIGQVLRERSKELKRQETLCIPRGEIEVWKNILRFIMGGPDCITICSYSEVSAIHKVAKQYEVYDVVEYCTPFIDKFLDFVTLLHAFVEEKGNEPIKKSCEHVLENFKYADKFRCSGYSNERVDSDPDALRSNHICYAKGVYLKCDNSIKNDPQYHSVGSNYEEIECKFDFSSVFIANKDGDILLKEDSDFVKFLGKEKGYWKTKLEQYRNESGELIEKDCFEDFKNIYRLSMGTNYIKAATIEDIMFLYIVSDFYDIPAVMKICRNLFEKHICSKNCDQLRKLSAQWDLGKFVKEFMDPFVQYDWSYIEVISFRDNEFFNRIRNSLTNYHSFYQ